MKWINVLIILLLVSKLAVGQELRCNISVNSSKLSTSNKNLFQSMQMDLYEFMNNRHWTNHNYKNDEKIECSFVIQLTKQISSDEYEATLTVQSKRPVYGSSYKTTVLNIEDEYFRFSYKEFQTIEYVENNNKDNLTSVLAFYAYIILGFDYDTFSLEGGSEYFTKAKQIVANSQSFTQKGWKSYESDYDRYWLAENMTNKAYAAYHQCLYQYHRKGLDAMCESVEGGRAEVAEALKSIQKVFRTKSKLYITQIFFDAKSGELVNIFSNSTTTEQTKVIQILSECDPNNATKYEAIKSSSTSE